MNSAQQRRANLIFLEIGRGFFRLRILNSTSQHAPQAAIPFDKFHVIRHLNEALDKVRKSEYARLSGKDRRFIQKYTLLSRRENLDADGRLAFRTLLKANQRLNAAYLLKESFC